MQRDLFSMVKKSEEVHYLYENEWQDVTAIYQKIKKSADPKARIQGSACVRFRENKSAAAVECVDARIVFVKDRHAKDWLALMCTDLELIVVEMASIKLSCSLMILIDTHRHAPHVLPMISGI